MRKTIEAKIAEAGARAVAASVYDYETDMAWSYGGNRWFHAASTIKVPVLAALFTAVEEGKFEPRARLHVRNWFYSRADGKPFQVPASRDANAEVHAAVGKTMRISELALHMVVTSSNLATNLLVDFLGEDQIQETLERLGIGGVDFQRGVEDERAYDAGINNRVTANGLLRLFRLIYDGDCFSEESKESMLDILFQQKFNSGIPAGLPNSVREKARIAHKTGEISTVAHDAGLVFLPERKPYAVAILTEWEPDQSGRRDVIADVSRMIYDAVTDNAETDAG